MEVELSEQGATKDNLLRYFRKVSSTSLSQCAVNSCGETNKYRFESQQAILNTYKMCVT
jgi:hypothetical protein